MEFTQMQLASAGGGDFTPAGIPVPPMVHHHPMEEGNVYPKNRKKKHSKVSSSGKPNAAQYHWYLFEQPDFPEEVNDKTNKGTTTAGVQNLPTRYKSAEQNNFRAARTTSTTRKPHTMESYTGYKADSYSNFPWQNDSHSTQNPSSYYMNHYDPSGWTEEEQETKEPLIEKIVGTLGLLSLPLACLILLPLLLFPVISLILFALPGIPLPIIISHSPEAVNSTAPMMMMMMPPSNSSTGTTEMQMMSTGTTMTSSMTESTMMMTNSPPEPENTTEAMQNGTRTFSSTPRHFANVNLKLTKPTKRLHPPHKSTAFSNDNVLTQDGSAFPFLFLNETYEDMHYRRNGKY